jgi:hypothetical protein
MVSRAQQRLDQAKKNREAFFAYVKDHPGKSRKEICAVLSLSLGINFTKQQLLRAFSYYKDQIGLYHTGHGKNYAIRYAIKKAEVKQTIPGLRLVEVEKIMAEKYGNKSPDLRPFRVYIGGSGL